MDCKGKGISDPSGCGSSGEKSAYSPGSSLAMDINENFSEKPSYAGCGIDLVSSLETPQVASVINSLMEGERNCFIEIGQTGDGNSICKEHAESSDAVCCNANDSEKQGVVSDVLQQTQGSISDAVLLVNCNKQDDGKESQEKNLSCVPIVSGSMQEKGTPQPKEEEESYGTILPTEGHETETELAFVNNAPEEFEFLETAEEIRNDEVGSDESRID